MKKTNTSTSYKTVKTLSKGTNTNVYLTTQNDTKLYFVVKQVNLENLNDVDFKILEHSYRILSNLNYKFILKFIEDFQTDSIYNIVTEYCDGGTLDDFIRAQKKKGTKFIKEEIIWRIFIQLALAVRYIHHRNIIHCNIKPSNVYLMSDLTVKLANMGVSKQLSKSRRYVNGISGTPYYRAPEIWEERPYDTKVDVWSIGVILYEMCMLKKPFKESTESALKVRILTNEVPPLSNVYSKELQNMIELLLTKDDLKRPTISDIIKSYVFISKSKNVNLFDYILKIYPNIDKAKGNPLWSGSKKERSIQHSRENIKSTKGKKENEKKEEVKQAEKEQINKILNCSRIGRTKFFDQLKNNEMNVLKMIEEENEYNAGSSGKKELGLSEFLNINKGDKKNIYDNKKTNQKELGITNFLQMNSKDRKITQENIQNENYYANYNKGNSNNNALGVTNFLQMNSESKKTTQKIVPNESYYANYNKNNSNDNKDFGVSDFLQMNSESKKASQKIVPNETNYGMTDFLRLNNAPAEKILPNENKKENNTNNNNNNNNNNDEYSISKSQQKNKKTEDIISSPIENKKIDNLTSSSVVIQKDADENKKKTFVPLVANDENISFDIETSEEKSSKNDYVSDKNKLKLNLLEDLTEKIKSLSIILVNEIGVSNFVKVHNQIQKDYSIGEIEKEPFYKESVQKRIENFLIYEKQLKSLEEELQATVKE